MAASLTLPFVPGYAAESAADLSEPETRRRLSPAALKGFLAIVEKWGLRDPDARKLLGGISTGSYYGLKKDPSDGTLDQDKLTRISLLVGIFKALNILYSHKLADAWMTLPNSNPIFRGLTPVAYIIQRGQPGMISVRQLLDARRGGQ
jgi:Protein of unknown function (DUF2384)